MKRARTLCLAVALSLVGTVARAAQPPKAQVMIVGITHFVARRDIHNSVYTGSPLSAKRQAQIAEVVDRLARFHPTKVLIEEPFGDAKYQRQYRQYLLGRFTLPADEAYQYGYKLAKLSGDPAIYPIDTWGHAIYNDRSPSGKRIDAYLKTHFRGVSDPESQAMIAHDASLQLHGTYLDELRYLNTAKSIQANASWYSIFDGMGRRADDAGSMYVAQWYTRNCFIFSNILSVIRPGDRVVVLMGQGHEYLLRQFVRLNPHLVNVDPLPYLLLKSAK